MPDFLMQISVLLVIVATGAMAASAAIQAVRHEFDAFGATVLALAAAMGGGTIRDILLGQTPVFWMTDLTYLSTATPVGLLTFLWARNMNSGGGRRLRMLMYFDAIGLALFTIAGVQAALLIGSSIPVAIIMGCITGSFGGIIRDVLCNVTPSVLREDLYATISLIGGGLYIVLLALVPNENIAIWSSFAVMLVTRSLVIYRSKDPKVTTI